VVLVCVLGQLYIYVVFARIVLSWFPLTPGSAMASVYGVLYRLTEPVLGRLRNVIPPIGMIDISPIVFFLVAVFVLQAIC
jgi:YggT family protein